MSVEYLRERKTEGRREGGREGRWGEEAGGEETACQLVIQLCVWLL